MGYSSPEKIGYVGYIASNDVLLEDVNEYTNATEDWVTVLSFTLLEDLSELSVFRSRIDLKASAAGVLCNVQAVISNPYYVIADTIEAGTIYDTWNQDNPIPDPLRKYVNIDIQLKRTGVAGTAYLKNFRVCGKRSPVKQTFP
jgi:hypothetical protein